MTGRGPQRGPFPDLSRSGDRLIVKGQPSGCPFCTSCLVLAEESGERSAPGSRMVRRDTGKRHLSAVRLSPRGVLFRGRGEDGQNDREMIRGSMLSGT